MLFSSTIVSVCSFDPVQTLMNVQLVTMTVIPMPHVLTQKALTHALVMMGSSVLQEERQELECAQVRDFFCLCVGFLISLDIHNMMII